MVLNTVDDLFFWCSSESFFIGVFQRSQWGVGCVVSCEQCSIIWTSMVIRAKSTVIQTINCVRPNLMLSCHVPSAICCMFLLYQCIQWPVGHIARVALSKRASPSSTCLVLTKCFLSMGRRE